MDCLVRRSEKMGGTIQAAANTEVLVTTGCQRERGNCMNDKRGMRQYIRVVFAIMDVGKSPKQWARGQIRSGESSAQLKHPSGPTANPSAPSFQPPHPGSTPLATSLQPTLNPSAATECQLVCVLLEVIPYPSHARCRGGVGSIEWCGPASACSDARRLCIVEYWPLASAAQSAPEQERANVSAGASTRCRGTRTACLPVTKT